MRNPRIADRQPRLLVALLLEHKSADIITLMNDESVRYTGSWKCCPVNANVMSTFGLMEATSNLKHTKMAGVCVWDQLGSGSQTHCGVSTDDSSDECNAKLLGVTL